MSRASSETTPEQAHVSTLHFLGRRVESPETTAALSPQAQSALRQFSAERLLGYGLAAADVIELRSEVLGGTEWRFAAERLAEALLERTSATASLSVVTRAAILRRASALLRMSQVMMEIDTPHRCAIYARASTLYAEAAELTVDRNRVLIDTVADPLVGWFFGASGGAVGQAIVIGGIEGWAMDFDSQGKALAARGIDALLPDGPGQGESRFAYGHYMKADWVSVYRGAIDFLVHRSPALPVGFVGNSLGGALAVAMAAADSRIRACCSNCGVVRTSPLKTHSPNFKKMVSFCGTTNEVVAAAVWGTVSPLTPVHGQTFPVLILHGAKDPAVSLSMAEVLLTQVPTDDKEMIVFSDGDHCLYNHLEDRDALIADWVRARLAL